tara:strand:+ start:9997 stop:10239 length:243 start_codon:yes stop_codon:yes gene_type:complete
MKEKVAEVTVNSLIVDIYKNCDRDSPYPKDHWWGYKVLVYDGMNDVSEQEAIKIKEYLYDEGFIPDRRIEYEIIKSDEYL